MKTLIQQHQLRTSENY